MAIPSGLLLILGLLPGVQRQEPRPPEPPVPVLEVPPSQGEEPRIGAPLGDRFTLRTIALRPRWELTTREFDIGIISGPMNFGDLTEFDRTTLAVEGRLDIGPWMISATAVQQRRRVSLAEDMTFEQHTFTAGTIVESYALFGTIEAFYRFDLAGGPAEPFQVSMLAGINWTKMLMRVRDDHREASEGFSALWPVPSLGVEARYWIVDRLSLTASLRGTRVRFDNPLQQDAGGSQELRYVFARFDGGLEWNVSTWLSLMAGYTSLDANVNDASIEDTDTADLRAAGLHVGVALMF